MMREFSYVVGVCNQYHVMCEGCSESTKSFEVALDCAIEVSLATEKVVYILCEANGNHKYLYKLYAESTEEFYMRQLS